jgi:hypothetical protein
MNVNELATRTIQCRTDSGTVKDVVLTVFEPVRANDEWQCAFRFHPPENQRPFTMRGDDCISALLGCLRVARGYVEHPNEERTSWQGMSHSGLPWHNDLPEGYQPPTVQEPEEYSGNLEILGTRRLGVPHGENEISEMVLTVYKPFCDESKWKCAFAFGTGANLPVRFGFGEDFIEAFLDALSLARVAYKAMVPPGWEPPESSDFASVQFLPFKIGREYSIAAPI